MFHVRNESLSTGLGVSAYGEIVFEPTATILRRFTVHYSVRPSADEMVRGTWSETLHVLVNPPAFGDMSPSEAAVFASLILAASARAQELASDMLAYRKLVMATPTATV